MERDKKNSSATASQDKAPKRMTKRSEYGRQLDEKQKVKKIYGVREKQFKRFFEIATKSQEATGDMLLSLLERRLDNVLFRLKMATTRLQARQAIVHGHVLVDGKKVSSPSYIVRVSEQVSLHPAVLEKAEFLAQVFEKKINTNTKVPDWLELDKKNRLGKVLRLPVRADIQMPIEDHLIVELYSK